MKFLKTGSLEDVKFLKGEGKREVMFDLRETSVSFSKIVELVDEERIHMSLCSLHTSIEYSSFYFIY